MVIKCFHTYIMTATQNRQDYETDKLKNVDSTVSSYYSWMRLMFIYGM